MTRVEVASTPAMQGEPARASPTVGDLARRLGAVLADVLGDADRALLGDDDPCGVWIASRRRVTHLGLRLDAGAPPYGWARGLDAVLVHRPFGLWPARLPAGVGVFACHSALDAWLWTAARPSLADALGVAPDGEPLRRDGRRVGVVGDGPSDLVARLATLTGPPEATVGDAAQAVGRVAVLGAMTDALVREAAARGATHVVTGQIRRPGVAAAEATGLAVVATGQDAAEAWALRALAACITADWPAIEVVDRTR